jgi:S1-C subfamily serine protease
MVTVARFSRFSVILPALLAVLLPAAPLRAEGGLEAAVLQKVKQATAFLLVKLPNGDVLQGSGFFADEPGVVVTNAHVLGMLEPNSRRPLQVDVVIHSGTPQSRTLRGVVLGVDRGHDLGAVRVEGKDLPEPLKLGSAEKLRETQDVFVFGFPFGRQLGKAITVSRSSVSSLRRKGTELDQVQVNGGMHPGNSGGPVIEPGGQVIGVAVAVIKGTQINFAIPGEVVNAFLNGRRDVFLREPAYKDGDQLKMPLIVTLIDPLARVQGVQVECWTGPLGKEVPDDSGKQTATLVYDKKGTATGEITLPATKDPKDVYWWKATVIDGTGTPRVLGPFGRALHMLVERRPIPIKYKPAPGGLNQVDLKSTGSLRFRSSDGDEGKLQSTIEGILREQAEKEAGDGGAVRFRLTYQKLNFGLKVDDKAPEKDERIAQAFKDVRFLSLNTEVDGEGNQTQGRADFGRMKESSKEILGDVCDQVLQSLSVMTVPLPGDTLQPLQTWKSQRLLVVGPLGMGMLCRADLKYKYVGLRTRNGRPDVMIDLKGDLRGAKESAAMSGNLTALLALSPETGQLVHGSASFKVDLDLRIKRDRVKANGEFAVTLNRGAPAPPKNPPPPRK